MSHLSLQALSLFVHFATFFIPEDCELLTIEARPWLSEASASFAPVRPRRTGGYSPVTEKKDSSESEDYSSDTLSSATNSRLFMCPEGGCIKSFMRHSCLLNT